MFLKKVLTLIILFFYKIKYGKRLRIKSIRQKLHLNTEIIIGKKALVSLGKITGNSNLHLECTHGELHIGRVCFNRYCIISCKYKISIGDNCYFGPQVCVYDHDHVYTNGGVMPQEFRCSEIIIEDGCWIGAGVIILRGTHVGKNSIVEAGAVVRGKIPPNSLVTSVRETRIIPTTMFVAGREALSNAKG